MNYSPLSSEIKSRNISCSLQSTYGPAVGEPEESNAVGSEELASFMISANGISERCVEF
jgi:hypothetical protein